MTDTDQTVMLSVDQAADDLGISPRRVRQLADEAILAGSRDDKGRWLFPKAEVNRLKAERKAGNDGKPKTPPTIDLRDLSAAVETAASAALTTAITALSDRQETHYQQLSDALAPCKSML